MKLRCKNCLSNNLRKIGFTITRHGRKRRYQCKDCGFVTVEPIDLDRLEPIRIEIENKVFQLLRGEK